MLVLVRHLLSILLLRTLVVIIVPRWLPRVRRARGRQGASSAPSASLENEQNG